MFHDDSGQATAEYALVIVAAALIALALIVWAGSTGCPRADLRYRRPAGDTDRRRVMRREAGSAVAEFAIVLPLVLVVLLTSVELVSVARMQLEVTQAAREGARQAATNVDPATAVTAVRSALPPGSVQPCPGQRHPTPPGRGPGRGASTGSLPVRLGPVRRPGGGAVRPGGDASRAVKSAVGDRPSAISQRTMLAAAAAPFPQGRVGSPKARSGWVSGNSSRPWELSEFLRGAKHLLSRAAVAPLPDGGESETGVPPTWPDDGSVGVLLLAVAAVILIVSLAVVAVGQLLVGYAEAEAAADAAALAAAPVTFRPFGATGTAVQEAGELRRCQPGDPRRMLVSE